MVCPVLDRMDRSSDDDESSERIAVRNVYFPEGCDWFDFYTGEKYEGGTSVQIKVPLDTIPVYARSGSVIPVCEPAMSTEELGDITFKRFGDGGHEYLFYTDDGDGYGHENGGYSLKTIT